MYFLIERLSNRCLQKIDYNFKEFAMISSELKIEFFYFWQHRVFLYYFFFLNQSLNYQSQVDSNGCPVCKCRRCRSMALCEKKCTLGLALDARGCPMCQCRSPTVVSPLSAATQVTCQTGNGTLYSIGQSWQVDQCTSCICRQGGATCTETTCPLPCHNPLFIQVSQKQWCFSHSFVLSRACSC